MVYNIDHWDEGVKQNGWWHAVETGMFGVGAAFGVMSGIRDVQKVTNAVGRLGSGNTILNSTNKTEAIRLANQLPGNISSSVKKFFKKSSTSYTHYSVERTLSGKFKITMTKPGNVPGSKAIYYKLIDGKGNTIKTFKDTFAPNGNFIHRKDK